MSEVDALSSDGVSTQSFGRDEAGMKLHRPTSARSQDVRHVLTRTFGDLFVKETISRDTIRNLITTRGGDDDYHERYVNNLEQALNETESQLTEIEVMEKHIMQAEAKALNADQRYLSKASDNHQEELGIPTGVNNFRSCLNYDLMKKFNLVTPDQYANYGIEAIPKPKPPSQPGFLKETANFQEQSKENKRRKEELRKSRFVKSADEKRRTKDKTSAELLDSTLPSYASGRDDDAESVDFIRPGSEMNFDDLDQIQTSRSAGHLSRKTTKPRSRPTWTEQLAVDQRHQERAQLELLQKKVNYLKNPRFRQETKLLTEYKRPPAREINVKQEQPGENDSNKQVFLASPAVVAFTQYQVGQVYETVLDLKNISQHLQPLRVLPTKTNYFSVGLGQFPGEQGLVASGMSAQFRIRFMPDCLGEFQDEIQVFTSIENTTPQVVKVVARRPPPILSLPPNISVGECLVGGTKLVKFTIKNSGGDGKFCFIDKARWPVTNFKSSVNPMLLDMTPFQLRPSVFELAHGEMCHIEVLFRPTTLSKVNHSVLLLCDNCTMKEFCLIGEGQMATVEFVAVDGGTAEPKPGELCDVSAQKLIRFDDLNPYTYTQKNLIVSNCINVALPFEWLVVKPDIVPPNSDHDMEKKERGARTFDVDSAFSIDPQNGVLDASGIANFTLTFAPPEEMNAHSILHLVLPGVPYLQQPDTTATDNSDALIDITALEVEVKAECIPLKVSLQPYAIYINGKSLIGTTVRRQFLLINNSVSPAIFQWETTPNSENILEVTPALGEVDPGATASMEVSVTGCRVGKNHEVVLCYIKHLSQPVLLHVDFEVKGPELYLDEADVNFGLIRYGTTAETSLTLHNDSQIPANYHISEKLPANLIDEAMKSEFLFNPDHGQIGPLQTKRINVVFYPQSCKLVRTFFELLVDGGGKGSEYNEDTHGRPFTVAVRADVQNPDVCLLNCNLSIPKLFVNMPMTQNITVINKTQLRTQYTWGKAFGSQAGLCSVQLIESGELSPREDTEIELTFTAHAQTDITDYMLPLHISGMNEPLLLSITASVEGLQVAYAVQDSPNMPNFDEATSDSSIINYGDVTVMKSYAKYLYLRNKTSIPTQYKISLNNFPANADTLAAINKKKASSQHNDRSLVQKTANIADPDSKSKERALIELQTKLLKANRGLVITADPADGQLAPYQELVVCVTLYSDMWGQYDDVLTCEVGDLDPCHIPIWANVKGSPIKFHMSSIQKDPTLRFGTHPSNSKVIQRTVRINNHSPCEVRLDWQMFNIVPDDSELIDLVVSYGACFPLKDSDGKEIKNPTPLPQRPPTRPPTEFIPNTPDSTLPPSRISMSLFSRTSSVLTKHTTTNEKNEMDEFVKVVVRPHDGHISSKPFTIKPVQIVIPARDKAFVELTFNPESGDPMGEICNSYILGYMNLMNQDISCENKFNRVIGYEMDPIRLNLSAQITPALLTNEYMDDEGLRFRTIASDLLSSSSEIPINAGQLNSLHCVQSGTKLTNLTQALLTFQVDISPPFTFSRSNPTLNAENHISLRPSESCEVYLNFCLMPEHLAVIRNRSSDDKRVYIEDRDTETLVHVKDLLKILFTSGAVQELPVHASVVCPSFTVDKTMVDFGTCLVGQTKQMTLIIKNRTRSASCWSLRPVTPRVDKSFVLSPMSGYLEAHITHVTRSEQLITIDFHSQDAETHSAEYLLEGILSEETIPISVTGRGSFDEKHEDLLNIAIR